MRAPRSAGAAAAALPTSARSVERASRVRAASPALFEQVRAGRLTVSEAERAVRVHERAARRVEPPPLSAAGTFPVLMADPPWRYEQGTTSPNRVIENHYPTMSAEEIQALRPPADPDAVMFLWATNPKLAEALEVLAAWGFAYRANLVWVKDRMGLGHFVRGQHELLLYGVRGRMKTPAPEDRPSSVMQAPRQEHSAKPATAYDLVARMYPGVRRVEMFARRARPGWDAWGNEVLR